MQMLSKLSLPPCFMVQNSDLPHQRMPRIRPLQALWNFFLIAFLENWPFFKLALLLFRVCKSASPPCPSPSWVDSRNAGRCRSGTEGAKVCKKITYWQSVIGVGPNNFFSNSNRTELPTSNLKPNRTDTKPNQTWTFSTFFFAKTLFFAKKNN